MSLQALPKSIINCQRSMSQRSTQEIIKGFPIDADEKENHLPCIGRNTDDLSVKQLIRTFPFDESACAERAKKTKTMAGPTNSSQ